MLVHGWQRYVPYEKKQIVLGCVHSLFRSAAMVPKDVSLRVHIIDDGSDDHALREFQRLADVFSLVCDIEQLGGVGFNASALRQFELCAQSKARWVYSVEDDYLHCPEALPTMLTDCNHFQEMLGNSPVAIHPYDDPFTYYHTDKMSNSKIVLGHDRHWRTNTFSTNTLFTQPHVFLNHFDVFAKLATEYGVTDTTEHTTINHLWNNGVDRQGPVSLFTPIPSLALHLSYNNEPPFLQWQKWWDEYSRTV